VLPVLICGPNGPSQKLLDNLIRGDTDASVMSASLWKHRINPS
jgi:hypothetical protein